MVLPLKRQGAEAAKIFGEHDGVGRVLARIHFRIDIGEQHGLARLQHDAPDTVAGRQRDAPVPVAGFAGAVHPLQRGSHERRDTHGHEVEMKAFAQVVDSALKQGVFTGKRFLAEIRCSHAGLFPLGAHYRAFSANLPCEKRIEKRKAPCYGRLEWMNSICRPIHPSVSLSPLDPAGAPIGLRMKARSPESPHANKISALSENQPSGQNYRVFPVSFAWLST